MVRGDVYYFADGSYGSYTFSQAASGTLTVEFRKAQSYDYGRTSDGCSNDISAGWNASTMGAGQANFTASFPIEATYFTLNGNGQQTTPGCGGGGSSGSVSANPPNITDCGFVIDNSSDGAGTDIYWGPDPAYTTLEYVEIREDGDNSNAQTNIHGYASNSTFTHLYMHNAGCVFIQSLHNNTTVSYSYFWGTETNGAGGGCHGQAEYAQGGDNNGIRHHNVYRDIIGTAIWTFAGNNSGTASGWIYYDNVVWYSNPTASWVSGAGFGPLSDGILACINSGTFCDNFLFYQNTIVYVTPNSFGGPSGFNDENGSTGYVIENNLWYQTGDGVGLPSGTQDHNSFLVATTSCPSGTANVCNNSSPNPFTNYPAGNFTLASDGANWNNRVSLSSPYTVDAAGNTFTTDRGAYQYGGGAVVFPSAPPTVTSNVQ